MDEDVEIKYKPENVKFRNELISFLPKGYFLITFSDHNCTWVKKSLLYKIPLLRKFVLYGVDVARVFYPDYDKKIIVKDKDSYELMKSFAKKKEYNKIVRDFR